jgi:hypothetical protein
MSRELEILICGPEEDALDRELQSKELARIMAASHPRPVIFLGYVVTKPLDTRRKWSLEYDRKPLCYNYF